MWARRARARRAQVLLVRPDLILEEIRGNIDTRLKLLHDGKYDAIILAMAGMERLGLAAQHVVPFDPRIFVPAVGQGALAVETRAEDVEFIAKIRGAINDVASEITVHGRARIFSRSARRVPCTGRRPCGA